MSTLNGNVINLRKKLEMNRRMMTVPYARRIKHSISFQPELNLPSTFVHRLFVRNRWQILGCVQKKKSERTAVGSCIAKTIFDCWTEIDTQEILDQTPTSQRAFTTPVGWSVCITVSRDQHHNDKIKNAKQIKPQVKKYRTTAEFAHVSQFQFRFYLLLRFICNYEGNRTQLK